MKQLRTALGFLTPLPIGSTSVPSPLTTLWFPVVGAVLGGVVVLAWWGSGEAFPPLVAGGLVVGVDLLLTGALHLDGLADSADGLMAHKGVDRERRLQIMRAPDVGAFGLAAVVVVLALRASAFASMDVDGWLVVALWTASRGCMALALQSVPYVGGGLGAAFVGGVGTRWRTAVLNTSSLTVPLLLVLGSSHRVGGVVALVGAWVGGAGVVRLARRRLGGITGDVLGAAGLVMETVGLVVASARW